MKRGARAKLEAHRDQTSAADVLMTEVADFDFHSAIKLAPVSRTLVGLMLYSCATPLGIYLESQLHVPNAFLLSLVNLPFLVILAPVLMGTGPLVAQAGNLTAYVLVWATIFSQACLAFIYFRRRAESAGISTSMAIPAALGRLVVTALITLCLGGLTISYLLCNP